LHPYDERPQKPDGFGDYQDSAGHQATDSKPGAVAMALDPVVTDPWLLSLLSLALQDTSNICRTMLR
jgi:hypothetical protein